MSATNTTSEVGVDAKGAIEIDQRHPNVGKAGGNMKRSGPTVVVDPDDGGCMASALIPGWKPKRILDSLDETIPDEGEPCVSDGRPCILYGMWDYAEDWSGDFVREVHPFTLLSAPKISASEFWTLVRSLHPAK